MTPEAMSPAEPPTIPRSETASQVAARAGLLSVAVLWGLNWPAAKLALHDVSPWVFRLVNYSGSALLLAWFAHRRGITLRVAPRARLHVLIAGCLNVAGWGILTTFAQLGAMTSRVAICAFTMPLWAALLARPILGERLDRRRGIALAIGGCGIALLLGPLARSGLPIGIAFALGAGFSWALGTVYLKWARIDVDPLTSTIWQLVCGGIAVAAGLVISGVQPLSPVHLPALAALAYTTMLGTGLGYLLWFRSAAHLPPATAGLGSLLVPVVGVVSAMVLLGERPSATDLAGFALITAAAAVTLMPRRRPALRHP